MKYFIVSVPIVSSIALALCLWLWGPNSAPGPVNPGPSPVPAPSQGLESLPTLLLRNPNKQAALADAMYLQAMFETLAEFIEDDGQQSDSVFKTGGNVDTHRKKFRHRFTGGKISFAANYPDSAPGANDGLAAILDRYMNGRCDVYDKKPFDSTQRANVVNAYRAIGQTFEYTAAKLRG